MSSLPLLREYRTLRENLDTCELDVVVCDCVTMRESIGLWGESESKKVCCLSVFMIVYSMKYRTLRRICSKTWSLVLCLVLLLGSRVDKRESGVSKCVVCSVFLVFLLTESIGLWGRIWSLDVVRLFMILVG
jgi:hypothetical protein